MTAAGVFGLCVALLLVHHSYSHFFLPVIALAALCEPEWRHGKLNA